MKPFIIGIMCLYSMFINVSECRNHQFEIKNDKRGYFPISTFGFYKTGYLEVDVSFFRWTVLSEPDKAMNKRIGFTLEKTSNTFSDQMPDACGLEQKYFKPDNTMVQQIFFIFDLVKQQVNIMCGHEMENLLFFNSTSEIEQSVIEGASKSSDSRLFQGVDKKKVTGIAKASDTPSQGNLGKKCQDTTLSMKKNSDNSYNFTFAMYVSRDQEEGLYNLNFYNCYNYDHDFESAINITLKVEEKNADANYLSAGEMPLPALYFMMSLLFLLSACFWFFILRKNVNPVFKIHYLMGILVVIKSLSLLFHAINYHFIQVNGKQIKTWAVMYYIMHLLKGALLFTVLALIGSGWAFVKHVLSSREKKIFMFVIPLQIIANVATVIIEETEESTYNRVVWMQLLFVVDFSCCGAILLPVVWSIRHLQEASQSDGKAAINLKKLKLFRHFYIMVVCYIYFTRIIVYLLRITVPFQYEWLDEMFHEMATYAFFVMVGYKFRPETNNPYFRTDSEDDLPEVLTTTGLTQNLTRVNQKKHAKPVSRKWNEEEMGLLSDDEEEVNLLDLPKTSSEAV